METFLGIVIEQPGKEAIRFKLADWTVILTFMTCWRSTSSMSQKHFVRSVFLCLPAFSALSSTMRTAPPSLIRASKGMIDFISPSFNLRHHGFDIVHSVIACTFWIRPYPRLKRSTTRRRRRPRRCSTSATASRSWLRPNRVIGGRERARRIDIEKHFAHQVMENGQLKLVRILRPSWRTS